MAARGESQGLQVALILFVMVTVVLAVTTYIYFRKSEEKIKERDQYRAQAETAKQAMNTLDFQNQALKHMLGFEQKTETELDVIEQSVGGDPVMAEVFTAFKEDMKMYGQGLDAAELNYRSLPKNLITVIREKNSQITEANKLVKELRDERDSVAQAEAKRTAAAVADLGVAQTDLTGERKAFNDERSRITAEKSKIADDLVVNRKQYQSQEAKLRADNEALEKLLSQANQLVSAFKAKELAKKETTYEQADGRISFVNQRSNTVWINLGSADGLKRQMTFSVYDRNETGVTQGKIKGRIEVTRIMESHLAEARILDDVLDDPILPDDKIYSPVFKRGQTTHYAITGFIDIDGDGKSDLRKLKAIIEMNGGTVDAELLEDGTVSGKISVDTKYLVRGEVPTDSKYGELRDGYSAMNDAATQLGVETITLDKVLDRLGYFRERRVVPLDRGGTGGTGNQGTREFRPRTTPPSAY